MTFYSFISLHKIGFKVNGFTDKASVSIVFNDETYYILNINSQLLFYSPVLTHKLRSIEIRIHI